MLRSLVKMNWKGVADLIPEGESLVRVYRGLDDELKLVTRHAGDKLGKPEAFIVGKV